MGFLDFLQEVGEGLVIGMQHLSFRELFAMDRASACNNLAAFVETATRPQLAKFEQDFLLHASAVMGSQLRVRSLELYAYFKACETAYYGQFHGFRGPSGRLQ